MFDPEGEQSNGLCRQETIGGLLLRNLNSAVWSVHVDEDDLLKDLFLTAPLLNLSVSIKKNKEAPAYIYLKAFQDFLEW